MLVARVFASGEESAPAKAPGAQRVAPRCRLACRARRRTVAPKQRQKKSRYAQQRGEEILEGAIQTQKTDPCLNPPPPHASRVAARRKGRVIIGTKAGAAYAKEVEDAASIEGHALPTNHCRRHAAALSPLPRQRGRSRRQT